MDIAAIKPVERKLEILHPGDETPIGVRVTLMSIDDDRMKKAKRRVEDKRLSLAKKGDTFKAEEIDANKNEIYFTAMTGWEWYGDVTFHGEIPEFNRKNVFDVFGELSWFRDQIEKELNETKAFFQA